MRCLLSLALIGGVAAVASGNPLVYRFAGVLPAGASEHSQVADGESWAATFQIDDTVPDTNFIPGLGTYQGSVLSGVIGFSGGYSQTLTVPDFRTGIFNDLDIGANGPFIDGVAVRHQTDRFVAQVVAESEVSPNPLLPDDSLVGPGLSFSQLGSTQSFYQLSFLDEVTGELISYNSVAAANTTFASFVLVPSDFNVDGFLDCEDVDALVAEIVAGSHTVTFDLTGDGSVDGNDLNQWLADAGAANLASGNPYQLGDANLDGSVDGQDFLAWNAHKFTATADWCGGDFNADGTVDGQDFLLWNANKFTSADGNVASVPEPSSLSCLLWLLMAGVALFSRPDQA